MRTFLYQFVCDELTTSPVDGQVDSESEVFKAFCKGQEDSEEALLIKQMKQNLPHTDPEVPMTLPLVL